MRRAVALIRRRRAPPSFTLVEAVVCTAVVGGMLVAALNAAGASRYGQYKICQRGRGLHLAQALIAEILPLDYEEPVDAPVFGAEISERGSTRTGYDDVDDYHLWSASPPQNKDGSAAVDQAGWQRRVWVRYVRPDNLGWVVGADMGVKRIEVQLTHNGIPMATLWAIRTRNDQQTTQDD